MGAIEVVRLGFRFPGGQELFDDVSFRVGDADHVALVGANGAGKTTLLRLLAGDEGGATGSFVIDGRVGVMRQFVGSIRDDTTVRDLLLSLAAPALQDAGRRLAAAESANAAASTAATGIKLADAVTEWGDAGGFEAEVLWDTCCVAALRLPFTEASARRVTTLSGGEQKRIVLEALLRGDDDVLLLDEPDNYLDVPGKEWLEAQLNETSKTILFVSHDRELLARTATKVVTIEGRGAWTHGDSFATWHEARTARIARIDEEHRRWQEERRHLEDQVRELRRRLQMTDVFANRLKATKTKIRRHEDAAPPERPRDSSLAIRLEGGRTGKRAVIVEGLAFPGIVDAFDTEVLFGERVGVLGLNGTGKSHFLRLLAGDEVPHIGEGRLGARVVPGHFSQTHDHPELAERKVIDILLDSRLARGEAMAALRRYELQDAWNQQFVTLSGGQQARLQILLLELSGANLLLLDEPTDNLDVASAEALEGALDLFTGTVLAVTHDRWFMRAFDRFLVFRHDGTVTAEYEPDMRT